jgi:sec-independent protein translocase protein TatB
MFDVGFAELFLLALVGLLVLGPERLPKAARTLGGLVRKARTSWYTLRTSIESELAAADIAEPVKSAGRELKAAGSELRDVAKRLEEIHTSPAATAASPDKRPAEGETQPGEEQAGEDSSRQ